MKPLFQSQLSRNTFILLLSNGGSAVLSFALSVLIGRALGETGLGIYASALAWIFPLSLITEFGLGTLITRDLALSPDATGAYLQPAIWARLVMGGGLMALVWLFAPVLSHDLAVIHGLRLSTPMIVLVPLYSTFTAVFRARQIMQPIAYLNLGMLVSQVALTTGVFLSGGGIYGALSVNVITSAGQVLAAWWIYRRDFTVKNTTHNTSISILDLLKRAWPFAIAALLGAMQLRLNLILLEQFSSTLSVGQYTAASRFVEAAAMIPAALFGALFPAFAALRHEPIRLRQLMRWILSGLAGYGVAFGIGTWIFGASIIRWTYGASFESSIIILQLLAWSLLPAILKSSLILYWYARGDEQRVNIVTGSVLLLQFIISLWFIRAYGTVGAALTIIVTEWAALILFIVSGSGIQRDKA